MTLTLVGSIDLPPHQVGGFDHGDVYLRDGRVFVAHPATNAVEVIDGVRGVHTATIRGCLAASGVLCAEEEGVVFVAARGAGKVLMLEAASGDMKREVVVGPKPNGLAWAPLQKQLLVADVQDFRARLVDPYAGCVIAETELQGRPRWCVYDRRTNRYLVNIRDPACVAVLPADMAGSPDKWTVSSAGPHGLDMDVEHNQVFVACDGGRVAVLDLAIGQELATVAIAGEPDTIWYNPDHRHLYVAIGKPGVIDVVNTQTMVVSEELTTEEGAHTTAFDRRRQLLYVFLPQRCCAAVYMEV